ncbi:hypothetical protein BG003_009825 [Podila horticola]|nr:hypothetical protein BG003_009825 [Podila horticola]
MSLVSSQARTPIADSRSRLSQFNTNKRISPPSPTREPGSKVVVVISDTDSESDDSNNLSIGFSRTNTTTTSINGYTQNNRTSRIQDTSVIELSSSDELDDSRDYEIPLNTARLFSRIRRASTPHPRQQSSLASSPSTPSSPSSARWSASPPVHIEKPPQPRPRPIRKSRGHSSANSQASAPPEADMTQEGRRRSTVTLSEQTGALGGIGAFEHLEEPTEYHGSEDRREEFSCKIVARLENASTRSTSDHMEDVKVEAKEESLSPERILVPAEMDGEESEAAMRDDDPAARRREEVPGRAGDVTDDRGEDIRRIKEYMSNILSEQKQGESEATDEHGMDTGSDGDEPIRQQVQLYVTGDKTETDDDHFMDGIESFMDAKDHFMTESGSFDEDFDYDADYMLGGKFELPSGIVPQVLLDIDYQAKMDESYQASVGQPLLYHKQVKERLRRRGPQSHFRPARNTVQNITQEELDYITWRVQECTQRLEPVDWEIIAGEANREYRSYRPIPVESWQRAFEDVISMYGKKPKRISDSTQFGRLARSRELGGRSGGRFVVRDRMHLALLKSYQFATTFNFSSASVVDMAIKCDGSSVKLAIANVATQDAYNRPGNLVFCDLEGGFCKHMAGHESFEENEFAFKTVTVNDVKLSYSKRFLYSGGDDGKAMIWDADTGKLLDQIADYQRSNEKIPVRVNRVAVIEDSLAHEDIFATCSSEGGINIYKVNEDGKVCMKNRPLAIQGAKRIISSLAFGHGHFWDCLVAGVEGPDMGSTNNADHQQGQVREFVVCGTSGRTSGEEDENGDGIIRIFDVKKTKEIQSAETRHEDVNLVDFSPCGNYVISCSHTNEITVFDRRFLPPKGEYRPLHVWRHSDPENGEQHVGITSAIWSPTFRQQGLCTSSQAMLMTGGGDGCVRLWDLRAATEDAHLWSMDGRVGPIARVAASPELEHIFVGGDTGAVNVYTIDQGIVSKYERESMHFVDESEEEN